MTNPGDGHSRNSTEGASVCHRWSDNGFEGSVRRHYGGWIVSLTAFLAAATVLLAIAATSMRATERSVGGLAMAVPAMMARLDNLGGKVDEIAVIIPRQQLIEGRLADMRTLLQEVDGRLRTLEESSREDRARRAAQERAQ